MAGGTLGPLSRSLAFLIWEVGVSFGVRHSGSKKSVNKNVFLTLVCFLTFINDQPSFRCYPHIHR